MSAWPLRIMVYGAGEAVNGASALAPAINAQLSRLAQIATNRYVAATGQLDASSLPTIRYVLDPSGRQPVQQLSNVDTGDPAALVDYVGWSAAICPADRAVLVLSGHGAAWEDSLVDQALDTPGQALTRGPNAPPLVKGGIHHARRLFGHGVDPVSSATRAVLIDGGSRDYLSNSELGAACDEIAAALGGKIDALVFDACLMSSWEILQEVCGSVATVVAAIDEISAGGIDMAGPVSALSAQNGVADGRAIATTIAQQYRPATSFDSCIAIDLSSPNWSAALGYFRAFCAAFLPWVQASGANADAARSALRYAATSIVEFTGGGLADVGALAMAVANLPGAPPDAVSNLNAAVSALVACELGRATGSDYASATGLSIFAPNSTTVYATNRPEYIRLQLPLVSGWSTILDALYGFESAYTRFITPPVVKPPILVAPPGFTPPVSPVVKPPILVAPPGFTPPVSPVTPPPGGGDAEFVVSLDGFPIDDTLRSQIEKAINRAVLSALAGIDALADVSVSDPNGLAQTRGLELPGMSTAGLVVTRSSAETRGLPPPIAPPSKPLVEGTGTQFRVVLQGLDLSAEIQAQIEAAIRSAALQLIAGINLAAPQTRGILGAVKIALGLVLRGG